MDLTIHFYFYIYIGMCIYIYVYICIYFYTYIYKCIYIYVYTYIYINIYTYTYTHTHIHIHTLQIGMYPLSETSVRTSREHDRTRPYRMDGPGVGAGGEQKICTYVRTVRPSVCQSYFENSMLNSDFVKIVPDVFCKFHVKLCLFLIVQDVFLILSRTCFENSMLNSDFVFKLSRTYF